ncbi:MAG: hypothetical protein K2X91_09120, partial [Thermoleophilia bacterium]|nr:hypothetical protein [Thermoleophilia bacterium]
MPSQIVTVDGVRMLRIWAVDVPSVGYAVYEARPVAGATFAPAATVSGVPGGMSTATIGVSITADSRDALSLDSGGAVREVRLSGYLPGDRHNYWSSDSEQETAGVQFPIELPPGTVVTDARLVLTAAPASLPSAAGASRIRAYAVDDAPAFVEGAQGDLAAFQPLAAGAVDWAAPTWSPGVEQTSPDLSSLVQAFVDRPGFTRGNTLGLVIDPGSISPGSYYGFDDFSKPGGTPARLTITYRTSDGTASRDLVLENGRYRVRVSPRGAITSLVDPTRAGREFAATIGGRAINDLGGGAAGDDAGTLQVEGQGPVSVTLVASTTVPVARTTRVTLYRDGDRIAMSNLITQNFSDVRDWSFAFSLASPRVRHEEVGAIATAALRNAGGSYATQNARYDWLTLNHFADMDDTSGAGVGVTLANTDVPFFRLGNSG